MNTFRQASRSTALHAARTARQEGEQVELDIYFSFLQRSLIQLRTVLGFTYN
ncbi:hypothetical protein SERLA73DRAFT_141963 [Serpula lacrymans var. lacrymans S7.3]|uniref:Uncharacterized protein n=1 Tax=Serpula lacrymans var. lacrymans (strain S7.3) TaxID=936435 RepID=F8Q727_SERL3|nr:hypothetical protein SERLA73DRAFT_141963 [Serpula lacrymans var. lacrymans S7.3]